MRWPVEMAAEAYSRQQVRAQPAAMDTDLRMLCLGSGLLSQNPRSMAGRDSCPHCCHRSSKEVWPGGLACGSWWLPCACTKWVRTPRAPWLPAAWLSLKIDTSHVRAQARSSHLSALAAALTSRGGHNSQWWSVCSLAGEWHLFLAEPGLGPPRFSAELVQASAGHHGPGRP